MTKTTLRLTTGLAVVAALLTACGSSGTTTGNVATSTSPTPTDSASSTGSPSDTPTSESSTPESSMPESSMPMHSVTASATSAAAALTKPGTQLKLGQPGVVGVSYAGKNGVVAVTPTTIRRATPAQLATLKLGGGVGYFVTMTVKSVGGAPDLGSHMPSSQELFAVQSNGRAARPVAKFAAFAPCEDEDPSTLGLGQTFSTCEIYLADMGMSVTSMAFAKDFDAKPITWKP